MGRFVTGEQEAPESSVAGLSLLQEQCAIPAALEAKGELIGFAFPKAHSSLTLEAETVSCGVSGY